MTITYEVLVGSEWVVKQPEVGDHVRYTHESGGLVEITGWSEPDPTNVTENKKITKLAFKQRLTQEERIAIREAAKVDINVEDYQDLLDTATYIDLALPDGVSSKLPLLEAAGLLAEGRADEIINAPVQTHELWNG